MKIKFYKVYTTHSLTAAIEMHKELVRRMKGGESLDIEEEPGLRVKIDGVCLRTYDHSGSRMHAVMVNGPIERTGAQEHLKGDTHETFIG